MGKCMNKTKRKTRRQISNNDSLVGVRTRARTLALQNNRLHVSSSSYLQLPRSRRRIHNLQSPPFDADERQRDSQLDGQQTVRTTRGESTPWNAASGLTKITDKKACLSLMTKTNPTTKGMEEFFSSVECRQQQLFKDKYNFDFENDKPLPGRFEWEKLIA